jgi:hypothetical protein
MTNSFNEPPKDGSCKGQDVSTWFPTVERSMTRVELIEYRAKTKKAIDICESCKVRVECLEYSLRHEPFGIWGGRTETERALLRSEKNIVLSREGRVFIPGVGKRNANGFAFKGNQSLRSSVLNRSLGIGE